MTITGEYTVGAVSGAVTFSAMVSRLCFALAWRPLASMFASLRSAIARGAKSDDPRLEDLVKTVGADKEKGLASALSSAKIRCVMSGLRGPMCQCNVADRLARLRPRAWKKWRGLSG